VKLPKSTAQSFKQDYVAHAVGKQLVLALVVIVCAALAGLTVGKICTTLGPVAAIGVVAVLIFGVWALNRPVVAAALVPLTLPFGQVVLPGGILQVAQFSMLLVVGLVILHRLAAGTRPLPWPPGTGWLVTLVIWILLAVPGASNVGIASRQAAELLIGALFVVALVGTCRHLVDVRRIVGLMLVGGLAVCLTAVPQLSSVRGSAGGAVVAGTTGIFSEHNQLGGFAAPVLMMSLGLFLGARNRWSRVGAAVTGAVALVVVALALSRGAYLGVALGSVFMLAVLPQARRALQVAILPLLCSAALLIAVAARSPQVSLVIERLQSFTAPSQNPYDARPQIWAEALRQIQAHPWTGVGPGNFPVVAMQAASGVKYTQPDHAHNVLLTMAAEAGLPAVAIMVLLGLVWTRLLFRAIRSFPDRHDSAVLGGLCASVAAFVGQGLVDFTLRSPILLLLLCTCVGLSLAAAANSALSTALKDGLSAPETPAWGSNLV
jgi:O-antigen ligase